MAPGRKTKSKAPRKPKPKAASSRGLDTYRAKRSAQTTPEPFGSSGVARPRLFVIQKHQATRLHYDFRLEWGGTLWSWAVPKGPSLNPRNKRLAVHVEDHPVEYADFEGRIPEGNYGAGSVIVWDKGLWVPIDDPDSAMETGKLHFQLQGYKLRGEWILVRTKGAGPKDWLLMKKADAYSIRGDEEPFGEESVFSGLTVEELAEAPARAQALETRLAKAKVPRKRVDAMRAGLMLAQTARKPFEGPEWIFELKYDGYRVLAQREKGEVVLRSRNGHDITSTFPDVARAVRALPYDLVLDGELVVLGEDGRPGFQRLQQRARLRRKKDIEAATVTHPATLFAFDLLSLLGHDLRGLGLLTRKEYLREVLPAAGPVRYADHFPGKQGLELYGKVQEMGLEGLMAKKAETPYRAGRSPHWLKLPVDRTGDFVVVGYTKPEGSRSGFGALHLGIHEDGELVYAGRVGTGFSDEQLVEFAKELERAKRETPPCGGPVQKTGKDMWVRPSMVVEVRYKTVTDEGLLRHPAFLRRRDDKDPADCEREPRGDGGGDEAEAKAPAASKIVPREEKTISFTNLDKVFWPGEGITKGHLLAYYDLVSPWLLPYLKDRPLVLTRYPDGIEGKSFYQKNVPDWIPDWVRTESVWSESSEKEIRYFVCDDAETLQYIVNSGAIPLHMWSSRVDSLANPDWCILDLDPKGAPFEHVVTLALAIRKLCRKIGLTPYVKTSGSTGLHVLLPLGRQCTYEQSRMLGNLVARLVEAEHRDIATTARVLRARKGKVYLDFLQNRHGQLLVAPYSVRPLPGAPVSAPLEWREVNAKLTPQQFTLQNLGARLKRKKKDPLLPVLTEKPDLVSALGKLAEMTG